MFQVPPFPWELGAGDGKEAALGVAPLGPFACLLVDTCPISHSPDRLVSQGGDWQVEGRLILGYPESRQTFL